MKTYEINYMTKDYYYLMVEADTLEEAQAKAAAIWEEKGSAGFVWYDGESIGPDCDTNDEEA